MSDTQLKNAAFSVRLQNDLRMGRMVYICAPFGWEKEMQVRQFLQKAETGSFCWHKGGGLPADPEVLLVLEEPDQNEVLQKFLAQRLNEQKRTILLSRTPASEFLSSFLASGQMVLYQAQDLTPGPEEIQDYYKEQGIVVRYWDLIQISRDFFNMPFCIYVLEKYLREAGGHYGKSLRNRCLEEIYHYYQMTEFCRFSVEEQDILLQLSWFDEISMELMVQILGLTCEESGQFLERIWRYGGVFAEHSVDDTYSFYPMFHSFLKRISPRYISEQKYLAIGRRALFFYENAGDYEYALSFAGILDDDDAMVRLLEEILPRLPEFAEYASLMPYVNQLLPASIRRDGRLVFVKAMLEAVSGNREEALNWLNYLETMRAQEENQGKGEELDLQARWLRIVMPGIPVQDMQNPSGDFLNTLATGVLFPVSELITSSMPSVIHGTKDFCLYILEKRENIKEVEDYWKNDKIMRQILPDQTRMWVYLGLGEVFYEQERMNQAMEALAKGVHLARLLKESGASYVGNVLMSRILIAKNQTEGLYALLSNMDENFQTKEKWLLRRNYETFLVYIDLIRNDEEKAALWLLKEAPDESKAFYSYEWYRYLMKVRVYLVQGQYVMAHMLLRMLLAFAEEYEMYYLEIQALLLLAILFYREKSEEWSMYLEKALEQGERTGMIRCFAEEGAALYPLLNEFLGKEQTPYRHRIYEAVKRQMLLYPMYLQGKEKQKAVVRLTKGEKDILRLLAEGRKNQDIAQQLCISENTVKYHLKNIYANLEVKSRSQAMKVAIERKYI